MQDEYNMFLAKNEYVRLLYCVGGNSLLLCCDRCYHEIPEIRKET